MCSFAFQLWLLWLPHWSISERALLVLQGGQVQGRVALCVAGLQLVPRQAVVQQFSHTLAVLCCPVQRLLAFLRAAPTLTLERVKGSSWSWQPVWGIRTWLSGSCSGFNKTTLVVCFIHEAATQSFRGEDAPS